MRLSGRVTTVARTRINCGADSLIQLSRFIVANRLDSGRIFILTDTETRRHCLPVLEAHSPDLKGNNILEIPAGDSSKTLQNAEALWMELVSLGADRNSLLINLGGGMITDLGGFVAAGFKRGIASINVPTTLLGQVDAAIGGKTGVNLSKVKNQVGFFYPARGIFIFPGFLETLPATQLRSGFAEVIKGALIGDALIWNRLLRKGVGEILAMPCAGSFWQELIEKTVTQKSRIVRDDFLEKNQRKILNFGHTVGHALETLCSNRQGTELLHGDAVAAGMVAESFLSSKKCGLPEEDLDRITSFIRIGYDTMVFTREDIPALVQLMSHDKKNMGGSIRFSLLKKPGVPVINIACDAELIAEALLFLLQN
jgi:3-dehydroquinate synthase